MRETISIPGFYEPFSSMSHLLGALVFAAASFWLLRRGRGDLSRMVSLAIFCLGAVFLLSMSGLFHMLSPEGNAKWIAQRLDHSAIFVLIAASFTPAHTILFHGKGRVEALIFIWSVAVIGITLKMIYFHDMPRPLGIILYLAMGWLGLFSSCTLWQRYGFAFVQPLVWGGLAYTVGAILEMLRWPTVVSGVVQWHEMLHLAVLVGLSCHWTFTFQIADGHVSPVPSKIR